MPQAFPSLSSPIRLISTTSDHNDLIRRVKGVPRTRERKEGNPDGSDKVINTLECVDVCPTRWSVDETVKPQILHNLLDILDVVLGDVRHEPKAITHELDQISSRIELDAMRQLNARERVA